MEKKTKVKDDKLLTELKKSIDEVNLAKQGKLKLKTLDELLKELDLSK